MTVKQHLGPNRDARDTLRARHRATDDYEYDHGNNHDNDCDHHDEHRPCQWYSQRRGGRYDSDEDRARSLLPDPKGLRAWATCLPLEGA